MKKLIVFTIDEKYIEPFIVAVESFSVFHNVEEYEIALVYSDISVDKIIKLKDYMENKNISFILRKIDDDFKNIAVGYHFNSVIFYRFLLADIFIKYKKFLYLDSDILFTGNIDELFIIDLDNKVLAAIPKHEYTGVPNHLKNKTMRYFASGLLLINTNQFKQSGIYEKCLAFLKNEKYEMPDQDALNATVDKWIELDLNYGVETSFLENDDPKLKTLLKNPKIIQFSGSSKPWNFRNKHPYKKSYWRYLRMTPFKRYLPEDLTVFNATKWMIPNSIKTFIKKQK